MSANPDDCARLKWALEKSLDVLGEPSKQTLLYYLQERHDISVQNGGRCFSLEEVEAALDALLGAGSQMIMDMVKKELGTADNGTGGVLASLRKSGMNPAGCSMC